MVWMLTVPGLFVLLFVLAVLERFRWLPRRRARSTRMAGAAGIAGEELLSFYNVTKKYELEQRRSDLIMPQTEGDAAPPTSPVPPVSRIDLDAGTAVLKLPGN
jgi:hypothetical protein